MTLYLSPSVPWVPKVLPVLTLHYSNYPNDRCWTLDGDHTDHQWTQWSIHCLDTLIRTGHSDQYTDWTHWSELDTVIINTTSTGSFAAASLKRCNLPVFKIQCSGLHSRFHSQGWGLCFFPANLVRLWPHHCTPGHGHPPHQLQCST